MVSEFDPARLFPHFGTYGHNALIGSRYVAHGPDWVELELPYRQDLVGDAGTGIVASGPIISLMDMATSMAIWIKSGMFRPQATLDLRVDYLRPATPGKAVIGRGECYKLTRSIGFVRGEAHDGDPAHPIAHVAGTFMFTEVG
jgi:uncharacterized protein (TIGR00369 family)